MSLPIVGTNQKENTNIHLGTKEATKTHRISRTGLKKVPVESTMQEEKKSMQRHKTGCTFQAMPNIYSTHRILNKQAKKTKEEINKPKGNLT